MTLKGGEILGFIQWATNLFKKDKKFISLKDCFHELGLDYYYKKLAIDTCINLIANSISRCEFQTFEKGKNVRKNNYYLYNVEPNANQNATEFVHELVTKLVYENECLVVMVNNQLFIADDFTGTNFAIKENFYKDVIINNYKLNDVFSESQVMHFKLRNEKIVNVIDGMYESFGKLLTSSMNYYKRKNNKRFLIKGDFLRAQDDETQDMINQMFEGQLRDWFDPNKEGSAFQLQEGYDFDDMSDGANISNGNSSLSRDVAALVDDIFNFVAMAFHVPRGMLKGDVADIEGQIDSFLMFGVNPITELISDEINRKAYSKSEYLERTYLKVDTTKIKVVDITKLATAFDKLFSIGGMTINDIIVELGKEPIDEEYADKRFVTKNYQEVNSLEGGENDAV